MPTWAIKPLLYLAGLGAIVWALHAGYSSIYQRGYDAKTLEVNMQRTEEERTQAIAALAREAEVRAIEVANDAKMRNVEAEWAKRMTDAQVNAERVATDLRSGALRLRQHWDACRATSALSGAAAGIAGPDADADLRRDGASDIVRVVGECSAHVTALQSAIRLMQGKAK